MWLNWPSFEDDREVGHQFSHGNFHNLLTCARSAIPTEPIGVHTTSVDFAYRLPNQLRTTR